MQILHMQMEIRRMERLGECRMYQSKMARRRILVGWEDVITIFVDNIPEFTPVYWLRKTCSKHGNVVDAYILDSRRGKGSCIWFCEVQRNEDSYECIDG